MTQGVRPARCVGLEGLTAFLVREGRVSHWKGQGGLVMSCFVWGGLSFQVKDWPVGCRQQAEGGDTEQPGHLERHKGKSKAEDDADMTVSLPGQDCLPPDWCPGEHVVQVLPDLQALGACPPSCFLTLVPSLILHFIMFSSAKPIKCFCFCFTVFWGMTVCLRLGN